MTLLGGNAKVMVKLMWKFRILLIGEDSPVIELFCQQLIDSDFEVHRSRSALKGLDLALEKQPDVILLNCRQGNFANLQLSRSLREALEGQDVSVIVIGENDDALSRRSALEAGADDYLAEKAGKRHLLSRINRILRGDPDDGGRVLTYADVEMDVDRYRVRRRGVALSLTTTQFKLLRHFLEHPHRVFTRTRLKEEVWGADSNIDETTINASIRRIRQVLGSVGGPELIRTVRGIGYSLDGNGNDH